jgi:hypothetical protein
MLALADPRMRRQPFDPHLVIVMQAAFAAIDGKRMP